MVRTMDLTATVILRDSQDGIKRLLTDLGKGDIQNHQEAAVDLCKEVDIHTRVLGYVVCSVLPTALFKNQFSKFLNREDGAIKRIISNLRLFFADQNQLEEGCYLLIHKLDENLKILFQEEERQIFDALKKNPVHDFYLGAELKELHGKLSHCPAVYQLMDLKVPIEVAYGPWINLESFPVFSKVVQEASRTDASHMVLRLEHDGREALWSAHVYEVIPNFRMAWTSFDGIVNEGSVSFRALSDTSTRMLVELAVKYSGPASEAGATVGMVSRILSSEMHLYKEHLESVFWEARKWRGNIEELVREQKGHSNKRVMDVCNITEATPANPDGHKGLSSLA